MLNYSVYHLQLGHIMCYYENHNTPKNVLSITFQNLHDSKQLILTLRLFDTSTLIRLHLYICYIHKLKTMVEQY